MKEKGITLIALVVTIIILLILAGVTIGVATNNSGLFEKAKVATEKYNNSVEKENIELNKSSNNLDMYASILTNARENIDTVELINQTVQWSVSTTIQDKNLDITLNDSVTNYKFLVITYGVYWNNLTPNQQNIHSDFINVNQLISNDSNLAKYSDLDWGTGDWYIYNRLYLKDLTTLHISDSGVKGCSAPYAIITSIQGIK